MSKKLQPAACTSSRSAPGRIAGDATSRTASSRGSIQRSTTTARMRTSGRRVRESTRARRWYTARVRLAEQKAAVRDAVDALGDELLRISHAIHARPELAFEEHAACALLVEALRARGLDATAGAYG